MALAVGSELATGSEELGTAVLEAGTDEGSTEELGGSDSSGSQSS